MQRPKGIRVLIANDQILVREGLATVINRSKNMEVVAQTGRLSDLSIKIRGSSPNVLLIDLRLEEMDSLEMIRTIRESFPAVAILIFSNYEGSEDIYRALRAGARGYLLHNASDSEVVEAIETVNSGRKYISDEIAVRLAERMDRSTLSHRELEVLLLIVKGKSNKEIAGSLGITEGTVKFHVNAILEKLAVTDRTQAATAALLRGIVHPEDL